MKKFCPLLFVIVLLLSSCSPVMYTQLFEVKANTPVKDVGNTLTFENDTLKIVYSFWACTRLYVWRDVTNKLSIPLYIDWKKSSYIGNDYKYNYWDEEAVTSHQPQPMLQPAMCIPVIPPAAMG